MSAPRVILALLALPLALAVADDEPTARPDRLVVVDAAGEPLQGVLLTAPRSEHVGRPVFDAESPVYGRSDALGVFDTLPSSSDVPGRLIIWAPGRAAVPVPATAFAAKVTLPEAESITGTVRFARGAPAASVIVLAVPLGDDAKALVHRAKTGIGGAYRFGALTRGRYEVQLLRSDKRLQPLGTYAAGDDVPDVVLVGAAAVAGRLLDGDGTRKAAAGGVNIRLEALPGIEGAGIPREARTDEAGRFLVGDLVPGVYRAVIVDARWELDQERPHVDVRAGSTQHMPVWFVRRRQSLLGTVVDADAKPLANATVRLLRNAPGDADAEARARGLRPARTDANGAFRMDGVSPGEGYRLVVTANGFAPHIGEPFEMRRAEPTRVAPVKLAPGWSLALRVRDDKGKGVPGVAVRTVPVRHPSADVLPGWGAFVGRGRTDAEGRVTLADLPDSDLDLRATADGWLEQRVTVDQPSASRVRELDVTLTAANRITGKVHREDGRRPGGYLVRAIPRDGTRPVDVRTDASGTFRFPTLRPVATDVEVRPLERGGSMTLARLEAVLPSTDPHLDIVLPATRTLRGLATGLDPEAGGATVLLEAPRYDPVLERHRYVTVFSASLDVDIRGDAVFELGDIPPGVYALRAVQGARDSSALPLRVGEEDLEDLRLPIPPGARVGGAVVEPRGIPILGVTIHLRRLRGDGDMPARPGGDLSGSTDAGGTFVFDDVAPGVWRLEAAFEGRATARRDLRVAEGEVVILEDITLDEGATIEGRALASDGEPFDGARVTARRVEDPAPTHAGRTDAEGRFRIPYIEPGAWVVTLEATTASGRRPDALVELEGNETATVDFAVAGRAVIEGTVTMRGRRIAGALLEIVHEPDDPLEPWRRHRTETDGSGRFRWDDLLQGSYRLFLEHGSARIEERIYVDDVDRLVLDLEAQEARLGGKVVTTQGARVPGAMVVARMLDAEGRVQDEGLVARGRTGPQGEFMLTGLPVGWYTVEVTAPGYPPGVLDSAQAELPGADQPVTVVLGRGGSVDLEVVDEGGRALSGARVWLEDVDGAPFHAQPYTTGPGGRLLLEGVPPGEVRVRVQARGFGRAPVQALSVAEGGSRGLRVVMRRPGTLRLFVRGTGRDPVTRARVTILREGTSEIVEERRPLSRIRLDPRWGYIPKTGILVIDDLEAGAYEVVIDAGDTYATQRLGLDIGSGAVTTTEIVLVPR